MINLNQTKELDLARVRTKLFVFNLAMYCVCDRKLGRKLKLK